ncbi:glutamate racemase [Balneola sp. MJW-20]|uniref:glutamate racemase n=1 Tax=Gracilimonas aurantiaca TaxID=3234185 RepID=UPI00346521FB
MKQDKTAPIGIFDSGIGGLTVARAVARALPKEDIIYFGDTARVPYGIKSEEMVREYALQITQFLLNKGVKMILIACNTVSASAKEQIIEMAEDIPVLDVISAGAQAVLEDGPHRNIGVIGTLATIASKAYSRSIHEIDPGSEVIEQACPLLVPLAEEGWIDHEVTKATLKEYLRPFEKAGLDALILGCTHYPLFKPVLPSVLKEKDIRIIDSADSIAAAAEEKLKELGLLNNSGGSFDCYVSDRPQRFQELAERFLGKKLDNIHLTRF